MTQVSPQMSATKLIAVTPSKSAIPSKVTGPSLVLNRFTPWTSSLQILMTMLRNVLVSTLMAWAIAFSTSRGNIFSSVHPRQQFHGTFITSSLLIINITSSLNQWCVASARCRFYRRGLTGKQKPSLLAYARRIARGSAFHVAISASLMIALAALCDSSWFPPSLKSARLDIFCATLINHYVFVATDLVAGRINRQETVRAMQLTQSPQVAASQSQPGDRTPSIRQVLRSYVRTAPYLLPVLIAGAYVQVTSQWIFSSTSSTASDVFVVASLALKILVQEIAKWYLERRKVKQLHIMCIFVSFPTVLIDTQVRVVILSLNNTQSTLTRTYGMSLLEILLRLVKVLILRRIIDRKLRLIGRDTSSSANTDDRSRSRRFGSCTSFDQWRKQKTDLHTAETFADMYAEYIAIGCSAAITFFFGNGNPHYRLGHELGGSSAETGLASTLVIQVLVEAVTDYFSCVMEMYMVRSEASREVTRLGIFLGVLSVTYAVVNVLLSALMYLKSW